MDFVPRFMTLKMSEPPKIHVGLFSPDPGYTALNAAYYVVSVSVVAKLCRGTVRKTIRARNMLLYSHMPHVEDTAEEVHAEILAALGRLSKRIGTDEPILTFEPEWLNVAYRTVGRTNPGGKPYVEEPHEWVYDMAESLWEIERNRRIQHAKNNHLQG